MKDRWEYLYKVDIQDTPSGGVSVKIRHSLGVTGPGWINFEITRDVLQEVGRAKAIKYMAMKCCSKISPKLEKEVLQSLKESWRIE